MTFRLLRSGSFFVLLAVLLMAPAQNASADTLPRCYEDWSVGSTIVKEHGLVSVEELISRAKTVLAGKIVKTTLCNTKDGYAYLVVMRTKEGQLKTLSIDALEPFTTRP